MFGDNYYLKFTRVSLGIGLATLFSACASAPSTNLPSDTDTSLVMSKLDADIKAGYDKQYDLTDYSDFTKAQEKLSQAQNQAKDKDGKGEVVKTLSEAQAYLNQAMTKSAGVIPKAKGILDSRKAALDAGIRSVDEAGLKSADDAVRSRVNDIEDRDLSPDKWSSLQANYLKLEVKAIEAKNLNGAASKVNSAIDAGARSYAPHLLKQAEWAIRDSRNTIATQVHNEAGFKPSVDKANHLAQLLTDVVAATDKGKVPEAAAQKIVLANRKINHLKSEVGEVSGQAAAADAELRAQSDQISLDSALSSAQKQFKPDEAEAYRQGNKLLLRLKGVDFAVGKTELPADSMDLLRKAKSIAMSLNPKSVVVEGNTDGNGSKSLNKKLSQGRAEAVASFLSQDGIAADKITSIGNGFEKPLASNKTKDGRAQNRRVDIIVTPSISNSSDSSAQ